MKKLFEHMLLAAVMLSLTATFTACSSDDDDDNTALSEKEMAMQALTEQYVNNVIYPIYSSLARQMIFSIRSSAQRPSSAQVLSPRVISTRYAPSLSVPVRHGSRVRHSSMVLPPTGVSTHISTPGHSTVLHWLCS